jgi:hypothetical protein
MVHRFEFTLNAYQKLQGPFAPILREKTFFEKPIATFFLVLCSVLILASIALMVLKHKFNLGGFFTSLGLFIPFAVAWFQARKKKQSN